MLLRLGELALEHSAELGPVTRRANFLAWECHFRGGTVTVAEEVVRNGWWSPHWHLTRGNIVFHNRADSSIIPPLPSILASLRQRKDWYITCKAPPEKGDPSGEGWTHAPQILTPIFNAAGEPQPCAAFAQLEHELEDEVDPAERDSTPLLVNPVTRQPLTTEEWRKVLLELFRIYLSETTGTRYR